MRPSGLEIPSCKTCNDSLTQVEAAFGGFVRLINENGNDVRFQRLLLDCRKRFPKFFDELRNDPIAKIGTNKLVVKFGPISKWICELYAVKLGFALFFDTFLKPLPKFGEVSVKVFTNLATDQQIEAMRLLDPHLTETKFLGQGKFAVRDQFAAQIEKLSDVYGIGFRAHFHEGINIIGKAIGENIDIRTEKQENYYSPGFFDIVHHVP